MDYEKLAEKIYFAMKKERTVKLSHTFDHSEILQLNRRNKKENFRGDSWLFTIKLIHDHFVLPASSFSKNHMLILKENLSKKEYDKFCKKINDGKNLSDAVKFCINLYNLIFTEEVP